MTYSVEIKVYGAWRSQHEELPQQEADKLAEGMNRMGYTARVVTMAEVK